jgi:hypothetical protein
MRSRGGSFKDGGAAAAQDEVPQQRRTFTDAGDAELSSALSARISQVSDSYDASLDDDNEGEAGGEEEPEPLQGARGGAGRAAAAAAAGLAPPLALACAGLLRPRAAADRARPRAALPLAQPRSCGS